VHLLKASLGLLFLFDIKKNIFYNNLEEGEHMDELKRVRNFDNRPLTPYEKCRMHMYEQEVIRNYESILKRPFMKDDILPLKRCLRAATPAQIRSMILRFKSQKNFLDFFYIVKPTEQMFKNKRGGKKYD